MSSYVYSTDPNPFHQILVISQKTINDSFKNMWELAQLDDEDSPLKHFKERFRSGDYLETDIGVPSVQLQVTTKDPMLYFMLRMTSGKLWLYLTNDPDDDSHIEWPVNDWVFAFSVTISKKEITKDGPEYQQFKERAGLPESNFSLAQLFIDASSTTKWDENLSSFGDREQDFKNLSPDAHATFDTFIQKWLNLMNEKKCNILGYSALRDTDSDLNKYEPTFPPTRIDYDCYPWRSNSYDQDQNNQDTNALCYLMMSNFESPSSKTLSYTGQFIDSSHDATFVMNRSLFWPWMFSVLRDVVVGMIPVPDEPTLYWDDTDPDHPYMGGMGYHFGDWNASSSYYNFTASGPGRWSWDGRPQYSSKRCQNPNRGNDSETIQQWSNTPDTFDQVFGTDPCGGTLSFDAGSASLTLNGKSRFVFRVDHDTGSRNKYSLMAFTLSWSIGVGMASVEEGGLVFKVTSNSVGVDEKTDGDLSWNPPADEVAREFTDEMGTSIQNAITNVEDRLMNALANQHRLFLPAKGSFLMKDPIFNSKGDLMVKLAYNGADPPKPPPKK